VSDSLRRSGPSTASRLSPRETEVLALLARGYTSAQVAAELFLSKETVDTHVRNASHKLGAHGRLHAVIIALGSGELSLGLLHNPVAGAGR
jgi:DNA-binding CsgD family transcriptional regulator